MTNPSRDHSVEHEPHLRKEIFASDPTEHTVEPILDRRVGSEAERVEHSVWDEPGLTKELTGPAPKDAPTYARWLERNRADTSRSTSRLVAILVAVVSGPWAIVGALFYSRDNALLGLVVAVLIAPVVEEVMKSAAALWVIEKRPYLFKSSRQIMFSILCGAFCFAAIENVMYLFVYVENPNNALVLWRWTICVALHMSCTAISGVGLLRVWNETMTNLTRPELSHWFPMLVVAALFHGIYNFTAFCFEYLFDVF